MDVMAKTNGLLRQRNLPISDFVCCKLCLEADSLHTWVGKHSHLFFCKRTKWSDNPNKFRLNSRRFMESLAFAKLF